ncbi:hypothetical protein [Brevibacillus centrosporus]|uniref:hypothetical protein n=1 Tax=Brevibacillus centrosporus TaxID=54910 RepID=UPI00382FBD5F
MNRSIGSLEKRPEQPAGFSLYAQLDSEGLMPSCHRTIGLSWVKIRYRPIATRHFRDFVIHYFSP